MREKTVRAFAPASISNLGPAFDVLGIAIDTPGDYVMASRSRHTGLNFSVLSRHNEVPTGTKENVAAHVASLILDEFKPSFGVKLRLEKKMPIGSGLGSSAASSVAAAVAVNAILPHPLKKYDLLRFVVEGERLASGSPHADNAAPSLLGGACLIRSYRPLDVVQVPVRNIFHWVVVHPHVVVRTETARRILPKNISLQVAVQQWGNVSGVTIGLMKGDIELLGKCIDDIVVEPVRAALIPGFFEVKQSAFDNGAFGCSISGSGPSMFAVAGSGSSARKIGRAMVDTFKRTARIKCDIYISHINTVGAHIVSASST